MNDLFRYIHATKFSIMIHRYSAVTLIFLAATFSSYAQSWKAYPYHQAGSVLNFPRDEGYHPGEIVEWWYTNAHLKGDSTGTDYAMMFTYFYYPTFGFDGFRIFELSNENTGAFLTETTPCHYSTLDTSHLHIVATTGITGTSHEEWKTLDSARILKPFQYHLNGSMANGSFDLTYNTVKRPLMVGGTVFLYEGITGYTYYYSETEIDVSGTITMNGVTETVHGIAWIDRQWGQFNPNNGEQYTWMSLQLSNGQDLNLWNIFNTASQIPDTSTYRFCSVYVNDSTQTTMSNFTLDRLKYTYTANGTACYDQKWRLTYGNVDLILTATHINNEVTLPLRFFEGSMLIEGTVDGVPVTGVGYVELLHSFSKPNVYIASPAGHVNWDGSTPIIWRLLNPDDGRPVYYDVSVSTDSLANFTTIANHLTDTSYNWTSSLAVGTEGWFRIKAYSIDTTLVNTVTSTAPFIFGATGIDKLNNVVSVSAFPNPFEWQTVILYELKQTENIQMDILNMNGEVVKRFDKEFQSSGKHQLVWNANGVAAGIYFYRLKIGDSFMNGKLVKKD